MFRPARSLLGACAIACVLASCSHPEPVPVGSLSEPEGRVIRSIPSYPGTPIEPVVENHFGQQVTDPYRWLENAKDPRVREWMSTEDHLARAYLGALPGRERLVARLKQLAYLDTVSAPLKRGGRYFYARRLHDKEKAIVYWREGRDGAEHVLIDPNHWPKRLGVDGTTSLGTWVVSWDGKKVAYALHPNNADAAVLHVRDVASGRDSRIDVIGGAKYAEPSWAPDGRGFYYTWLPTDPKIPAPELPAYQEVRYHRLGTAPKKDAVIHAKLGNPELFQSAEVSRDGKWLFLEIYHGWTGSELYLRPAADRKAKFRKIFASESAQIEATEWDGQLYLLTNDGAPKWALYKASVDRPERESWRLIVPERQDAVISDFSIIGDRIALTVMKNALSSIEVRDLEGNLAYEMPTPGVGTASGMRGNPGDDEAYFEFESYNVPRKVYRVSVSKGKPELWFEVHAPIDPAPYVVKQVWYPSKDGTKISMFIVRRKDQQRDGSNPYLLTGYGGFDVSEQPYFSAMRYAWLEAGGSLALPNLRGGGEYGEEWHRAGMLAKKQNVFDDFISAAQYLIDQGYTSPAKLGISGASNGGLLVGAALVERPDLFRAVICGVPLLDMVRYPLFGAGKTWIPEYGSPDVREQFKVLYAYSPYHHVKRYADYPAVLFQSADSDDRVDPMHARKMAAALQAATESKLPVLLWIESHSGHGGADMLAKTVERVADSYAFLMAELGMNAK